MMKLAPMHSDELAASATPMTLLLLFVYEEEDREVSVLPPPSAMIDYLCAVVYEIV